jgi:hypothetical protein
MSQVFIEDALRFEFPDEWLICRPESSSFYARHFQWFAGGCKEMDFLAYDRERRTLWMIEVKDYSYFRRTKDLSLEEEVAKKVRDVLAMLPASIRDNSDPADRMSVRAFWREARQVRSVRVVLHCELPPRPSKLFPGVKDAANLQTRLRAALRVIDPHARVMSRETAGSSAWSVVRQVQN